MLGFDRITFDPKTMAGQACIRGMRVPVSLVLNLVANGQTPEAIIEDYPYLEPEDIQHYPLYSLGQSNPNIKNTFEQIPLKNYSPAF